MTSYYVNTGSHYEYADGQFTTVPQTGYILGVNSCPCRVLDVIARVDNCY